MPIPLASFNVAVIESRPVEAVAVAVFTPPKSDGFASAVLVADGDVVIVVAAIDVAQVIVKVAS